MKQYYLDIIDPIHDFVRVKKSELQIIDHPSFQRLRRIRQLSGGHLTYPGAQHTRFEHSLGTMHIANQAGIILKEKNFLNQDSLENLRIAALLHDIGHGPFSHLFEEVIQEKSNTSHEEFGKKIILKTELGDILTKEGFNKKFITELAFGYSKKQFMNEVISGPLSADMMDYLLRDGYFTGAEHAKVDHKRITQSFDVYQKRLALEKSALYSFESLMHSRYQMFKAVYFHKTVRAAEVMLLESLKLADEELNLTSSDLDNFLTLTDEFVLSQILTIKSTKPSLKRARQFALDYQNRNLLKCVYERIFNSKSRLQKIRSVELREDIAKKAKVDEIDVFVDTSVTPSIPLAPAKKESQSVLLVTRENQQKHVDEFAISEFPLVDVMSGFMNILRVYTPKKYRKKVEIAAQAILGELV